MKIRPYLKTYLHIGLTYFSLPHIAFLPSLSLLTRPNASHSFCLTQVRQRVSVGSSSDKREQILRDVGSNTASTSCRMLRSCLRYCMTVLVCAHVSACGCFSVLNSWLGHESHDSHSSLMNKQQQPQWLNRKSSTHKNINIISRKPKGKWFCSKDCTPKS